MPYLNPKAEKELFEQMDADKRVWQLMDVICAEFQSDPESVKCFDLRIVQEAVDLVKRRKKMDDFFNPFREQT